MIKELTKSEDLEQLANKVIEKESLDFLGAKIGYILVNPNISKTTAGRCIRTNRELKFFSELDYIVEMSEELWNQLDDDTKYILMLHELMHIYVDFDKNGDKKFLLKDHDIKDFEKIIKKYGIDWYTNLKTQVASVYDFDKEEDINL